MVTQANDSCVSRQRYTSAIPDDGALVSGSLLVPLTVWLVFFALAVIGGLLA